MNNLTLPSDIFVRSSVYRAHTRAIQLRCSFARQKITFSSTPNIETQKLSPCVMEEELPSAPTRKRKKKKQSTLFVGPGAVKQRITDKRNRTHYVPLDDESINAIAKHQNVNTVECQCENCGKTFVTAQGLGNHMNQ